MLLAFAGVVGLWGIGFFSYDLFRPVLEKTFRAQGLAGAALAGKTTTWIGITSLLQNFGAFFGIYAFTWLTQLHGPQEGVRGQLRRRHGDDGVYVLESAASSATSSG